MAVFKSSRYYPVRIPDLAPVAYDLEKHFQAQDFMVHKEPTIAGGWRVDISKGGAFKAVLGMKTAMNIEIEPSGSGTQAKAGIGIFGQQAIPTAISMLIFWPVLIPQIWGMVQQSGLDDEALAVVDRSLTAHSGAPVGSPSGAAPQAGENGKFCPSCGHAMSGVAKFCPECGVQVA